MPDLHAQVTARDQNGMGRLDDFFQVFDGLGALDLGHESRLAAGFAQQLHGLVHVFGISWKRHGQVIHVHFGGTLHVEPVVLRNAGRRQPAAALVQPLAVAEHTAGHHGADDLVAVDLHDLQGDQPVVQQQGVAGDHVGGQVLVGYAHPRAGARLRVLGSVQGEAVAGIQGDGAVDELLDPDLGSPQVGQDRDLAAQFGGNLADVTHAPRLLLG